MKKIFLVFSVAAVFTSCSLTTVDGDECAVFVKKPWFFGSGGVSKSVLLEGSEWAAWTTDNVKFKTSPVKYEEKFDDVFSDDGTPVDLQANFILQVDASQAYILLKNYGADWYSNVVKETGRKYVRDRISQREFYKLLSDREIYDEIEADVIEKTIAYFKTLNELKPFPVHVVNVVCDRARPNLAVMEEIDRTASNIQAKKTEDEKFNMQVAREKSEKQRALADRAYRTNLGLSGQEFIALKALDIEREKVEMVRGRDNVNVDILMGTAANFWDIKNNR
ncbi:hypothetical protein SAMD00024442_102_2 [Candidatus Symbiothrix dinenymphae]|nr:hypothetical protein SAMD00024442_102_2 [Candidatus Symbiothrix dinenymphae]